MNTLQDIADTMQKVALLEQKLQAIEILALSMPKAAQDMSNVTLDIQQLTRAIQTMTDVINKRTSELAQMDNMLITRQMGLEQSVASFSKTLAAIASELSDTNLLDQTSVVTRIRKSDERSDQERVAQMEKMGVIRLTDKSTSESLLVVSQTFTKTDGQPETVSEFRSVDLSSEVTPDAMPQYVGKSPGDVLELKLEDGVLQTTVLQVYDFVKVQAVAEEVKADA
jgi:hypothetical protein